MGPSSPTPPPHLQQVTSLKDAASKQLGSLHRAPGSPYQRVLSPAQREALKADVADKLQRLASSMQERSADPATLNPQP